jgi:hypothetical protein
MPYKNKAWFTKANAKEASLNGTAKDFYELGTVLRIFESKSEHSK